MELCNERKGWIEVAEWSSGDFGRELYLVRVWSSMVASWEDLALVQQYFLSPTLTHPTNVSQKAEYNDYISHIQMYIF